MCSHRTVLGTLVTDHHQQRRAPSRTVANTLGCIVWKKMVFVFYIVQNKKLSYEHRTPPPQPSLCGKMATHCPFKQTVKNQRTTTHPPPRAPLGDTRPLRKQLPVSESTTEAGK